MNPTADLPTFAELLDFVEGRLAAPAAQALAQRLASAGPAAQADLAWVRAFHAARARVRLANPPPGVRAELRGRFARRAQAQAAPPPGLFARLVAALTFDSGAQWAAAGLRGASGAGGGERQLLFATPTAPVEIALNLHAAPTAPDGPRLDLHGQVFAGDPAPLYAVQLLRDGAEAALAATDDLGEFFMGAVPRGEYALVLSASDHEIHLPSVRLET